VVGLALAGSCITFAALVTRFRLGFGFSLVFVPLVTLLADFEQAFLTSIALEVVVGALLAWEHRDRLRMKEAAWLKVCGVAGAVAGVQIRHLVSLRAVVVSAMVVIVVTCVAQLARPSRVIRRSRPLLGAAGLTSGALNSWTSLSGPPVVLYYLATEDTDDGVRASLSGYFLLLYLFTLGLLAVTGSYRGYDGVELLVAGMTTIALLWRAARALAKRLPGEMTTASLALLLVAAFVTGARALIP
jgi:hypothetical protein